MHLTIFPCTDSVRHQSSHLSVYTGHWCQLYTHKHILVWIKVFLETNESLWLTHLTCLLNSKLYAIRLKCLRDNYNEVIMICKMNMIILRYIKYFKWNGFYIIKTINKLLFTYWPHNREAVYSEVVWKKIQNILSISYESSSPLSSWLILGVFKSIASWIL